MGADKRLAHLVLQTTQLPVMRDWYLRVLDARWRQQIRDLSPKWNMYRTCTGRKRQMAQKPWPTMPQRLGPPTWRGTPRKRPSGYSNVGSHAQLHWARTAGGAQRIRVWAGRFADRHGGELAELRAPHIAENNEGGM
jgi:hypothetical protein